MFFQVFLSCVLNQTVSDIGMILTLFPQISLVGNCSSQNLSKTIAFLLQQHWTGVAFCLVADTLMITVMILLKKMT